MTTWIEPIEYINEEVPNEAVSIQGHVVQKWEAETPIKQVGLFGDPTGSLRFVQWDDIHEIPHLVVGGEYLIENVRAQTHEAKVSVVFTDDTEIQRLSKERNPRILRDVISPQATPDVEATSPPISFQSLRPTPNRTIEISGLSEVAPPWDVPSGLTLKQNTPRLARVTRSEARIEFKYRLDSPPEGTHQSISQFKCSSYCVTTDGNHTWDNGEQTPSYFVFHYKIPFETTPETGDDLATLLSDELDTPIHIYRVDDSSPLYSRGRAISAQHDGITSVELHSTEAGEQIRLWCTGLIPHRILPRVRDTVRDHGEHITAVVDTHRGSRIDLTTHNK